MCGGCRGSLELGTAGCTTSCPSGRTLMNIIPAKWLVKECPPLWAEELLLMDVDAWKRHGRTQRWPTPSITHAEPVTHTVSPLPQSSLFPLLQRPGLSAPARILNREESCTRRISFAQVSICYKLSGIISTSCHICICACTRPRQRGRRTFSPGAGQ